MSASLVLQGAIITRLRSYEPLTALVDNRVYDSVPADAPYPYVDLGEEDAVRTDATCIKGETINLTLHAWSDMAQSPGRPLLKRIASAVAEALHEYPLDLPGYRLVSLEHRKTRTLLDVQPHIAHAIIELVAYVNRL